MFFSLRGENFFVDKNPVKDFLWQMKNSDLQWKMCLCFTAYVALLCWGVRDIVVAPNWFLKKKIFEIQIAHKVPATRTEVFIPSYSLKGKSMKIGLISIYQMLISGMGSLKTVYSYWISHDDCSFSTIFGRSCGVVLGSVNTGSPKNRPSSHIRLRALWGVRRHFERLRLPKNTIGSIKKGHTVYNGYKILCHIQTCDVHM